MPRDAPVTSAILSASGFDIVQSNHHLSELSRGDFYACWASGSYYFRGFCRSGALRQYRRTAGAAFTRRSIDASRVEAVIQAWLCHAGAARNSRVSSWVACVVADGALDVARWRDHHDCKLAL